MTPEEYELLAALRKMVELLMNVQRAQGVFAVEMQKLVMGLGLAVSNLGLRQCQFRDVLESIVTSPLFSDEKLRQKIQGQLWRQDMDNDQLTATTGEMFKDLSAKLDALTKMMGPINLPTPPPQPPPAPPSPPA